jgi:hypothetical protein
MTTFITLVAILCLLVGMAAGWYLRRVNNWCPQCGDVLTCNACGSRATWYPPSRARRTVR